MGMLGQQMVLCMALHTTVQLLHEVSCSKMLREESLKKAAMSQRNQQPFKPFISAYCGVISLSIFKCSISLKSEQAKLKDYVSQ